MAGTLGQISFFVALLFVILIHEAAHFGMAKWFGFKVEEFFVGFGPRIWSFRRGETEYGVKAIPAGGYVKIAGMNPFQEPSPRDIPRAYGSKPIWQRALVIVAGPSTHFVLAFFFFAIWLGFVGEPRIPLVSRVLSTLAGQESPAAAAGLEPGDRIVDVAGTPNPTDEQVVKYTQAHTGQAFDLRIQRGDRVFTVEVTPIRSKVGGQVVGRIGVVLSTARARSGVVGAVTGGARLVWTAAGATLESLGRVFGPEGIGRVFRLLFTAAPRQATDVVSPVGIGRAVGQVAETGRFGDILFLFASVNVFIGLLNLLPLPPFDGGHVAVLVVEKIRGRKVDMKRLIPISVTVAAFLVLFVLSLVYLDFTKPINLAP